MHASDNVLGPLFFFVWTLVGLFILTNMFFAVLDEAITAMNHKIPRWEPFYVMRFSLKCPARLYAVITWLFSSTRWNLAGEGNSESCTFHEMLYTVSTTQHLFVFVCVCVCACDASKTPLLVPLCCFKKSHLDFLRCWGHVLAFFLICMHAQSGSSADVSNGVHQHPGKGETNYAFMHKTLCRVTEETVHFCLQITMIVHATLSLHLLKSFFMRSSKHADLCEYISGCAHSHLGIESPFSLSPYTCTWIVHHHFTSYINNMLSMSQ
jgi:hypothetical protein